MKKKFVSNLIFLVGLNLLVKPFWIFGIDRSVQNAVGAAEYGIYYALFNFSFLFNILLDLGITNFNNRNIAQNQQLLGKHLSGIILIRFSLSVLYFLVSFIFAWALGYELHEMRLLFVMLFNQILISFILYLRSNLAGLHMFKTDSLISVLDRLIMIFVCGFLLWAHLTEGQFRLEWFILTQTFSYSITALVAFSILLWRSRLKRLSWSWPFFLMILKKSYPYATLILLMTFSFRIDSVMLERLLPDGAVQAGIYAQAFRLLDAAAIIGYLFAALLLPIFSRMLKLNENVESLTRLSFSLIMVPSIILAIGSFAFSKPIMEMLYHQHTLESSNVLGILMICFVSLSSSYIFGTLLTANGSLKYLNITAFSCMVLNIGLNLILIPAYKVNGAAWSCLITQTISAFIQVVIAKRVFNFPTNTGFISRFILFTSTCLSLFWLASLSELPWIEGFLTASCLGVCMAFVFRIFSWKEVVGFAHSGS